MNCFVVKCISVCNCMLGEGTLQSIFIISTISRNGHDMIINVSSLNILSIVGQMAYISSSS